MKALIHADRCSGHGRCYSLAPAVYTADDAGYNACRGQVIEVPPGREAAAREGAESCPEAAIELLDDAAGE